MRQPSLWRAWSPIVYQVAGVAVACVGATLVPSIGLIAIAGGAGLWWYGFTHRPR